MKKIAVNTVKNFIKEARDRREFTISYTIEDSAFEVVVKSWLSVVECSMFINRVVDGCFDINGNYMPEYFEPLFKVTVLQMATNLPVISLKEEKGDEEKYVDIDAMTDLWVALDAEKRFYKNAAFCDFFDELYGRCRRVVEERLKDKRLEKVLEKLSGFELLGKLIESAKDMVDTVNDVLGDEKVANMINDYIAMQGEVSEIKS